MRHWRARSVTGGSECRGTFEEYTANDKCPQLYYGHYRFEIRAVGGAGGDPETPHHLPMRGSRNAAISSPLRTSRTSPASTGWFQVLPSIAGSRASSVN